MRRIFNTLHFLWISSTKMGLFLDDNHKKYRAIAYKNGDKMEIWINNHIGLIWKTTWKTNFRTRIFTTRYQQK